MTAASKRLRLALIGISGYGRIHLQLAREWRDRGDVEIRAAVVINPEQETENIAELQSRGCEIFADYEQMLAQHRNQIDLCLIPTGIHWHARMTVAALNAGANVLVEKPLAGSVAEIADVRATEKRTGRFVAVGFQDVYEEATNWLHGELRRGAIGEIQSIRFLGLWPRSRFYFTRNDWAGRLQADGAPVLDSPLNNAFAHFVMLSLFFGGGASEEDDGVVIEQAELYRAHHIQSFDTSVVSLRTRRGVRLWFGASHACRETVEPEIIVQGTEGSASWRYENEACLQKNGAVSECHVMPDTNVIRRAMMAAVIAHLSDPSVPICSTGMAARHTAVIEAIHRAARIREFPPEMVSWISLPGIEGEVPQVAGLDAALRKAFDEQSSLQGVGFFPVPVSDPH
ncbi:MAG TPA: Gfo/Idh/MocA family oxidoreductase [Opitutaceae bacterium]|nr:Gfo/Idh/MocA family oxidoreductase [Opitutaceae bacterium]